MARSDLKTRTPIGSAVDIELYNQLRDYSKESGIPISKLLDRAIKQFLASAKK